MVVLAVVGAIVVLGLAVATVYMAILGGLGMLGAVHLERCQRCGHLVPASGRGPLERCGHCQHVALYHHPLQSLHHAHLWHRGASLPQGDAGSAPARLAGSASGR